MRMLLYLSYTVLVIRSIVTSHFFVCGMVSDDCQEGVWLATCHSMVQAVTVTKPANAVNNKCPWSRVLQCLNQ